MAYQGVCFEISVGCPRCSKPIPLNRATESVLCEGCRQPLETPVSFWQSVLGDAVTSSLALPEGEGGNSTMFMGQYRVTLMYGHQAPRCANESCKAPFPEEAIQAGIDQGLGTIHCIECGKAHDQRRPPPWFAQVHPMARLLVRESPVGDRATRTQGTEGIPFHCYHCGGAVPLNPGNRQVLCGYCGNQLTVPDEIWVRVNPVEEKARWYAVLDIGSGAGVMPGDTDDFCDVRFTADGELLGLYHARDSGEAGHPCRVTRIDAQGFLRWLQDGIEFDDDSRLLPSYGDGNVWILDTNHHFLRLIDVGTGDPLRTLEGTSDDEDETRMPLGYVDVAVDHDGTILIHQDRRDLRRYDAAGNRVPVWEGQAKVKPGLFKRMIRSAAETTYDAPSFAAVSHQPARLPEDVKLRVGWDGRLYVLHEKLEWLLVLDRAGRILTKLEIGARPITDQLLDWGVDAAGCVYILFEHAEPLRDSRYPHIGRILPGGRFEVWLGPHTGRTEPFLGSYSRHLAVARDGDLVVAHDFDDLRRLSPDGSVLWRSPGTTKNEEYQRRSLAEDLKGKKKIQDRG